MNVHVHYMAQLRAAAGRAEEPIELPPGSSLLDLLLHVAGLHDDIARHLLGDDRHPRVSLLVAHNGYAIPAAAAGMTTLAPGDNITLLPPIAGG